MVQTNNVWVVDDDRSIRWVLERALEQEGMTPVSFASGDLMLKELTLAQPDAIISDIRMPGIDGLALLERVHSGLPRPAYHHHDRALRPRQCRQLLPERGV